MKTNLFKTTLATGAMAVLTFQVQAQKAYLKINGGYNFGSAAISESSYTRQQVGTVTTYEKAMIKPGKGLNLGGSFGYMFNPYLGTELNVSYLFGGETTARETMVSGSTSSEMDITYGATMLHFTPSFIITPGFDKINPYARFGATFGISKITMSMDAKSSMGSSSFTNNSVYQLSGGLTLGFQSALGVNYNISDKLSIFGEVSNSNITYRPKKGELIESKLNGVDNLSSYTISEKETVYVDSYTEDTSVPEDKTQPTKDIKPNIPLNSIGLSLGIVYHF